MFTLSIMSSAWQKNTVWFLAIVVMSCGSRFQGNSDKALQEAVFRDIMLADPSLSHSIALLDDSETSDLASAFLVDLEEAKELEDQVKQVLEAKKDPSLDDRCILWYLENSLISKAFRDHEYPISTTDGLHLDLIRHFQNREIKSKKQIESFLGDLLLIDGHIGTLVDELESMRRDGIIAPDFILEKIRLQCDSIVKAPIDENPIYVSFQSNLNDINLLEPTRKAEYLKTCKAKLAERVIPAYVRLSKYLQQLEGAGVSIAGVWRLKYGTDYYRNRLKWHTGFDGSIDSLYLSLKAALNEKQANDAVGLVESVIESEFPENTPVFRKVLPVDAHIKGLNLLLALETSGGSAADRLAMAKLVVDIGIHSKRWLREQAVDYLISRTGMNPTIADEIVIDCIAHPGLSAAEKLGQLQLVELKKQLLKKSSSLDFNSFLLEHLKENGPLPIEVLTEVLINEAELAQSSL